MLGGVPFFCHHAKTGEDFHDKERPPLSQLRVCEGWKAAIRKQANKPAWRAELSVRRAVAKVGLGALEKLVNRGDDDSQRESLLGTIKAAVEALAS